MSKVVVKTKKLKMPAGMRDNDVADMFNSMLGTGSLNMSIAYPRYIRIKALIVNMIKTLVLLNDSPVMVKIEGMKVARDEINRFVTKCNADIQEHFSFELQNLANLDIDFNVNNIDDVLRTKFTEIYEKSKKCYAIRSFIIMCDRLTPYKTYIGDDKNLSHEFIEKSPDAVIEPFPWSCLNLKYIFSEGLTPTAKRLIVVVLNKLYSLSHNLYREITTPDIDLDEFIEVIKVNLKEIRKIPELHRCGKAFDKIEKSVSLLKDNFSDYYRDFVSTQNSTIIMENFIIDVSKSTNPDPETTSQFRLILQYYQKVSKHQSSNPKVQKLFEKVAENLHELDRETKNLVNIRKPDGAASDQIPSNDADEPKSS